MSTNYNYTQPDYTFARAHGTVMVFSWIVFASTGILFARYGRTIHFNKKKQLLGEDIWFQTHRFFLTVAVVGTLLGFFLILRQASGQWVDPTQVGNTLFAHSILGGIIVGCALIQAWMALFRCHPDAPYRYIFNMLHRTTGMLAFTLSVPAIFLAVLSLSKYYNGFVTIMSLWAAWFVIVFIIFEIIQNRIRSVSATVAVKNDKDGIANELNHEHSPSNTDAKQIQPPESDYFNKFKLILFLFHFCLAICFVIILVVLIWMQG
jgi:hypothetical protein